VLWKKILSSQCLLFPTKKVKIKVYKTIILPVVFMDVKLCGSKGNTQIEAMA
jgi:hypothetical protein